MRVEQAGAYAFGADVEAYDRFWRMALAAVIREDEARIFDRGCVSAAASFSAVPAPSQLVREMPTRSRSDLSTTFDYYCQPLGHRCAHRNTWNSKRAQARLRAC